MCYETCPAETWGNSVDMICHVCDSTCSTCSSSKKNGCESCGSGYYFNSSATTCQQSCDPGYYDNASLNTCDPCDSACTNCTGPTYSECSSCSTGYSLQSSSTTCCTDTVDLSTSSQDDVCSQSANAKSTSSWSLAIFGFYVIWILATMVVIHSTEVKEICWVESFKKKLDSKEKLTPMVSYVLVMSCIITHPLMSIYLFKASSVSKIQRAWVYFVRSLAMLIFSCPFVDPKNKVTLRS